MYVQITTKCNMNCSHCYFKCNNDGNHMNFETYKNAISLLPKNDYIIIGGGEPTIHPQFNLFLNYAVRKSKKVNIVTNGKNEKQARFLLELAKKKIITASLSLDQYHDKINQELIKDWTNAIISDYCNKNIQINSTLPGDVIDKNDEKCIINHWFVMPNGNLYQCGCIGSIMLGNVNKKRSLHLNNDLFKNCCYKKSLISNSSNSF